MLKKAILILWSVFFIGCTTNGNQVSVENDKLGNVAFFLDFFQVEYHQDGNLLFVTKTDENYDKLQLISESLLTEQKIFLENIQNADVTNYQDGRCYLRKDVYITERGVLEIEIDRETPTRLIYDPSHPDAIEEGEHKGYVEYPNVDIHAERRLYELSVSELNTINALLSAFVDS